MRHGEHAGAGQARVHSGGKAVEIPWRGEAFRAGGGLRLQPAEGVEAQLRAEGVVARRGCISCPFLPSCPQQRGDVFLFLFFFVPQRARPSPQGGRPAASQPVHRRRDVVVHPIV